MANLFDSDNYPTTEPSVLIAGDRWAWKRSDLDADYPIADYALTYDARLEAAGSTTISLTATESGNDYIIEVASATTAAYTVGVYHWAAYITRSSDSERIQVDAGTWTVKADKANATTDPRTDNKIILDKIIARLKDKTDTDVANYSIAGRSLSKYSTDELERLRDKYQARVNKEIREERRANGQGTGALIKAQF